MYEWQAQDCINFTLRKLYKPGEFLDDSLVEFIRKVNTYLFEQEYIDIPKVLFLYPYNEEGFFAVCDQDGRHYSVQSSHPLCMLIGHLFKLSEGE